MEEKDVNSIANAVSSALAKLNTAKEATDKRSDNKGESNESEAEVFSCPDCGAKITGGIGFCQACGCALEWEE
jgi:hypothetical protein